MGEQGSGSSTLYLIVGGLVVAVLGIGYLALSGDDDPGASIAVAAPDPTVDPGTKVKIDVGKDGRVSGTFEKEE